MATGEPSGISILDVDISADAARDWWRRKERLLPLTRTYRTRSGGLHLLFQHTPGIRCTAGKPIPGIDSRGDGKYIIYWFAAGYDGVDHHPPALYPKWLREFFWPPAQPKQQTKSRGPSDGSPAAIEGLIRVVRDAKEGDKNRNNKLNWAAYHLRKYISARTITEAEARRCLMQAAENCGLPETEAARTIRSAWEAA